MAANFHCSAEDHEPSSSAADAREETSEVDPDLLEAPWDRLQLEKT